MNCATDGFSTPRFQMMEYMQVKKVLQKGLQNFTGFQKLRREDM